MSHLKLMISDKEYLLVNYEPFNEDNCMTCTHCDIDYINEDKDINIRFGYDLTSSFCYFISECDRPLKIIDGKMVKDPKEDLGFQWNQYYQGKKGFKGDLTHLFQSNSHKGMRPFYNSWIYNDQDGTIIFEITPFYPWHNTTKKTHPERISYKEWIKDYKPTIKTVILRENLIQWIEQTKALKREINGK